MMMMTASPSIQSEIERYIQIVKSSRSANTAKTYLNALLCYTKSLEKHNITSSAPVSVIPEGSLMWLIADLKASATNTERLYLTAVLSFFDFLIGERLVELNLPRLRLMVKQRARRPGIRLPQFPRDMIESVLDYAEKLNTAPSEDPEDRLRNLRDRAFLITLADTGLRVHEACNLRRGDIDWNEGQAIIIGKGDKQAVVRFSRRSQGALREYLSSRAKLDGASGKQLSALPLFARHDPGAGKKVKPITTTTGRNIVAKRVQEALGADAVGRVTPHSFRHYFVTRILQISNNLKLAQELARHSNIAVTQRYAHLSDSELDQGYWQVFEDRDGET